MLVISYPKLFNGMKLAGQLFAKAGTFQKVGFFRGFCKHQNWQPLKLSN